MNHASFLLHWLSNPTAIGAVMPSSTYLANAMVQRTESADQVIEVGAGTGAITRVLARQVPQDRLIIVEPNAVWASGLARRYPRATVIPATIQAAACRLQGLPERTAILSSIPFRSLPAEIGRGAAEALVELVRESPRRSLVQFSYQPRPPFKEPEDMVWKLRKVVVQNIPPAGVWELRTRQRGRNSGRDAKV